MTFPAILKRRHALWFEKKPTATPIGHKIHSKKACQKRYNNTTEALEPPCCPYWQRRLANKWNARLWASAHGATPPRLLWSGTAEQLSEISWETLPSDFVIKPTSGWSCQGVLPLHRLSESLESPSSTALAVRQARSVASGANDSPHRGLEPVSETSPSVTTPSPQYRQLFTGEILTVSHILQRCISGQQAHQTGFGRAQPGLNPAPVEQSSNGTAFLIEEMVRNEDGQPGVPTDYKCYLFGGRLHSILAIQRTGPHSGSAAVFDRHWQPLASAEWLHQPPYPLPDTPIPRPRCLKELVATAERLGTAYGTFVRIDMYATPEGPLFGEFTPFPNGAHGYNPSADRHLATWYALDAKDPMLQRVLWMGYERRTVNRYAKAARPRRLRTQPATVSFGD